MKTNKDEFFVGMFVQTPKTSINPYKEKQNQGFSEKVTKDVAFKDEEVKVVEGNKLFILQDRGHCCASMFGVNGSNNTVDGKVFLDLQVGYELDDKSFKCLLYSSKDPSTSNNLLDTIKDVEKRQKKCVYGKFNNDEYTKLLFTGQFDKRKNKFEFDPKNRNDWLDYVIDESGNLCYITSKGGNLYEIIKNKQQYLRNLVREIVQQHKDELMKICGEDDWTDKSSKARKELNEKLTNKYIPKQHNNNSLNSSFYNDESNTIDDYKIAIYPDFQIEIYNISKCIVRYNFKDDRFLCVNGGNNCLHNELDLIPKDGKDYINIKRMIVDFRQGREQIDNCMMDIVNMTINEIKAKDIRVIDEQGVSNIIPVEQFIDKYCTNDKLKEKAKQFIKNSIGNNIPQEQQPEEQQENSQQLAKGHSKETAKQLIKEKAKTTNNMQPIQEADGQDEIGEEEKKQLDIEKLLKEYYKNNPEVVSQYQQCEKYSGGKQKKHCSNYTNSYVDHLGHIYNCKVEKKPIENKGKITAFEYRLYRDIEK